MTYTEERNKKHSETVNLPTLLLLNSNSSKLPGVKGEGGDPCPVPTTRR